MRSCLISRYCSRDDDGKPNYCKFKMPLRNSDGTCERDRLVKIVLIKILATSFSDTEVIDCTANSQFAYGSFQFEETLVTKWNLVCSQEAKVIRGILRSNPPVHAGGPGDQHVHGGSDDWQLWLWLDG